MGALMKCDAVYETPFWREEGLSGTGLNTEGAVRTCFDNSPKDAAVGVLLSFVGGSTWETYGTVGRAARRRAEDFLTPPPRVIARGPVRHHLDRAARQAEQHRPHRVGAAPVDDIFERRRDDAEITGFLFYSHRSAPFFHS